MTNLRMLSYCALVSTIVSITSAASFQIAFNHTGASLYVAVFSSSTVTEDISSLDEWTFINGTDVTNKGNVLFQTREDAEAKNLTFLNSDGNYVVKVDNTTSAAGDDQFGRDSVMVWSNYTISEGNLVIMDAVHIPFGVSHSYYVYTHSEIAHNSITVLWSGLLIPYLMCLVALLLSLVWPAFWMEGPNWPNGGEIDIIEGVSPAINRQAKYPIEKLNLHIYRSIKIHLTQFRSILSTGANTQITRPHRRLKLETSLPLTASTKQPTIQVVSFRYLAHRTVLRLTRMAGEYMR